MMDEMPKCIDCTDAVMSLVAVGAHASNAAQTIVRCRAPGELSDQQQSAMGIYSLLLVGQLAGRCMICAEKSIVTAMAETMGDDEMACDMFTQVLRELLG